MNWKKGIKQDKIKNLRATNDRRRLREFSKYKKGEVTVLESENDMVNYEYTEAKFTGTTILFTVD